MKHHTPVLAYAHGSFSSYLTGFILSVILTLAPFMIVINQWMSGWILLWFLVAFAVMQLLVQLVFFLHIRHESTPRWNLVAFIFMFIFLLIIVVGSLWVMHHLNYNMMSAQENDAYMLEQSQKGF